MRPIPLLASVLIISSIAADDGRDAMLARSLEITDGCLAQLSVMRHELAALQPVNLQALVLQNEDLTLQLKELNERYLTLRAGIDESSSGIAIASEQKAAQPQQESTLYEGAAVSSVSDQDVGREELLLQGRYRVVAHSINVRSEPKKASKKVSVVHVGDIVDYVDVKVWSHRGKPVYWLKTAKGWLYATDSKEPSIASVLAKMSHKTTKVVSETTSITTRRWRRIENG